MDRRYAAFTCVRMINSYDLKPHEQQFDVITPVQNWAEPLDKKFDWKKKKQRIDGARTQQVILPGNFAPLADSYQARFLAVASAPRCSPG